MVTSRKVKGRATSMPAGVTWGAAIAICNTFLLVAAVVWLILANKIVSEHIGYYIMGILLLSSFLGALVSGAMIKRRWLMVSAIVGTIYYLTLLLMTAFVFGGQFQGIGITGVVIAIGCVASGTLGVKMNNRTGRHARKYLAG